MRNDIFRSAMKDTTAPVTTGHDNEQPRFTLLSDLISDLCADADAAHAARLAGKPRGPLTGLPQLDDRLGGYLAPGICTVTGNSGTGKTAFALQVAGECSFPALFVSAEMSMRALFYRLIARKTETFLRRLKDGTLTGSEVSALAVKTAKACPNLAFVDGTREFIDAATILKNAEILKARTDAEHILIVIDSLHAWVGSGRGSVSEYDAIEAGLGHLREISSRLNCAIMLLSHRNRASQSDSTQNALNAAKGHGGIEHYSQVMIDLSKDKKDAEPDLKGEYAVNAFISKNRDEAANIKVPLIFCGRLQRYREETAKARGAM